MDELLVPVIIIYQQMEMSGASSLYTVLEGHSQATSSPCSVHFYSLVEGVVRGSLGYRLLVDFLGKGIGTTLLRRACSPAGSQPMYQCKYLVS
jgi:hypothetical protein